MTPKWIPFHLHEVIGPQQRHMAPASRCPFVKAHITLPQLSENKIWTVSHSRQGNATQVWLMLLSKIISLSVQGLCAASPFLSSLPPTLSSRCDPCALSDITADTRQRRTSGEILLINIFVWVPALSKLILSCSAHALQSLQSSFSQRFVNVDCTVIKRTL